MSSVNKVILVGRLGQDPEVREFSNGGKVTNVSIATSERWTDKQTGEPREMTEWHRVVFNNKLADIAAQYLRKGSQVYVEGGLRTRKWTDKEGKERYTTEIRADSMQMLGRPNEGAPRQSYGGANNNGGHDSYNRNYEHIHHSAPDDFPSWQAPQGNMASQAPNQFNRTNAEYPHYPANNAHGKPGNDYSENYQDNKTFVKNNVQGSEQGFDGGLKSKDAPNIVDQDIPF